VLGDPSEAVKTGTVVKEGGKKRKLSGCDEEEQHLLIRPDKNITGFKGVRPHHGRYKAVCETPPEWIHSHMS
jgi:hypothetical protein